MRILLDTSALIWWAQNDRRLGSQAASYIADPSNQVFVSALTILEYAIKSRLKKLPPITNFQALLEQQGFIPVHYTAQHADSYTALPTVSWNDPFDLALVAQTKASPKTYFLTSDRRILSELTNYIPCLDARV